MTLSELLTHIHDQTGLHLFDKDPGSAITASQAPIADDNYAAQIIRVLTDKLGIHSADEPLPEDRSDVINALGSLRLKYFADDAPPEGLRFIERFIFGIDGAYDDEALRLQGK